MAFFSHSFSILFFPFINTIPNLHGRGLGVATFMMERARFVVVAKRKGNGAMSVAEREGTTFRHLSPLEVILHKKWDLCSYFVAFDMMRCFSSPRCPNSSFGSNLLYLERGAFLYEK
ncbi:hypothetical protein CsSME_00020318 [Camellia sinensis var. sinensis]